MANFCENCGSPLKNDNRFCPNCGAPVKQTEPAAPVAPDPSSTGAGADTAAVPPSVTSATSGTSFAASGTAGATAAATVGALHAEPAAEKTQESFGPPQQQMHAAQQSMHGEAFSNKESASPSPRQEYQQDIPQPGYKRREELARGGIGPKYEPDKDIQSMFLRYDNRLNRKRYIMRALALWAAVFVVTFILGLIASVTGIKMLNTLGTIISIASAIPGFMLVIRRLHDLDRPTWWCIGCIIPLVNIVLAVYLLFFKGTTGFNQYGPDPLEAQD